MKKLLILLAVIGYSYSSMAADATVACGAQVSKRLSDKSSGERIADGGLGGTQTAKSIEKR